MPPAITAIAIIEATNTANLLRVINSPPERFSPFHAPVILQFQNCLHDGMEINCAAANSGGSEYPIDRLTVTPYSCRSTLLPDYRSCANVHVVKSATKTTCSCVLTTRRRRRLPCPARPS